MMKLMVVDWLELEQVEMDAQKQVEEAVTFQVVT